MVLVSPNAVVNTLQSEAILTGQVEVYRRVDLERSDEIQNVKDCNDAQDANDGYAARSSAFVFEQYAKV